MLHARSDGHPLLMTGLVQHLLDTGCVAWDKGAWRLDYRVEELTGVELIVDRQVAARAFRGEARRPLDRIPDAIDDASLRLIFDDAQYPDFEIRLWPGANRAGAPGDARAAISEANRWLARVEAILRLPLAAVVTKPATPMAPLFQSYAAPPEDQGDDDGDDEGGEPLQRRLV
jgi:hypothetical protein